MPTWKEYAKAVLRDSFMLWERGERLVVFAGVVFGSLAFGIAITFGLFVAFRPEVALWFSVGLLLWLGFLIFVVSPYRVWKTQAKAVWQLRKEAEPALEITFSPELPFVSTKTVTHLDGTRTEYRYCIMIKNKSSTKTIKNVVVHLSDIIGYSHFYKECPLITLYGQTSFDLAPEQAQYIQVARWIGTSKAGKRSRLPDKYLDQYKGVSGFQFNGCSFDSKGREVINEIYMCLSEDVIKKIPFARYTFVLTAFGEDVPKTTKRFRAGHAAKWVFSFHEMSE